MFVCFNLHNSDSQPACETEFQGSPGSILQDLQGNKPTNKQISFVQKFQYSVAAIAGCIGQYTQTGWVHCKDSLVQHPSLFQPKPSTVTNLYSKILSSSKLLMSQLIRYLQLIRYFYSCKIKWRGQFPKISFRTATSSLIVKMREVN